VDLLEQAVLVRQGREMLADKDMATMLHIILLEAAAAQGR
jgi:hypothetical protein